MIDIEVFVDDIDNNNDKIDYAEFFDNLGQNQADQEQQEQVVDYYNDNEFVSNNEQQDHQDKPEQNEIDDIQKYLVTNSEESNDHPEQQNNIIENEQTTAPNIINEVESDLQCIENYNLNNQAQDQSEEPV